MNATALARRGSLLLFLAACALAGSAPTPTEGGGAAPDGATFTNPLLPSGADPWSIHKDGWYYYMHTTGRNLTLWKTRSLADLATAERKVVWTPPATGPYSRDIWAPEIHHLDGKWYIYFAADSGQNRSHRMWVIENASPDPMQGEWEMKGKVSDPTDRWAIDGSVFEHGGRRYFVWSGWEGAENGRQDLYIARMRNPWTLEGERVRISKPEHPWERVGTIQRARPEDGPTQVDVNEGPQFLQRGDNLFLVYSASGCWTDAYTLGVLRARAGSDLLDPAAWTKSPAPAFQANPAGGAHAPGHNSFFKSPDGKEDWILYHANPEAGQGCGGRRSPRMQRIAWRPDGTPDLGRAVSLGQPLQRPSGE